MTNAHRMCDHASLDVEDVFAYQYLVAPGRAALDGFDALPFGKFSVYSGRKLHKARVFDAKQRFFGYVLGIAVDREGLITGDRQLNDIDLDDPQVSRVSRNTSMMLPGVMFSFVPQE
jgi:hypothetical protein